MSVIYSNQNVERVNCRSYFIALGGADFTVASSILNKNALLLSDAKDCLVSYIKRVYEKRSLTMATVWALMNLLQYSGHQRCQSE